MAVTPSHLAHMYSDLILIIRGTPRELVCSILILRAWYISYYHRHYASVYSTLSSIYMVSEGLITLLTNQRASAQPPIFFLRQHPLKRRGRLTERPVLLLPTPSWHKLRGSFTAWPALHYIWPLKGPWTFKNTWSIQVWAHHHILRVLLLFAGERIFSIKTSRNNGTPNHCDRLWVIAHSSFSHEAYWWSLSSFDQYWQFLFHEALLAGYNTTLLR